MKDLSKILDIRDLNKLVEKGKAVFFKRVENFPDTSKQKFLNLSEQKLLKLIDGNSHVLVDSNLYTKEGNFSYGLEIENWLNTEEAEKYAPLLLKMFTKEALSRYFSRHLN